MANIRINDLPPTTTVMSDDVLPMDGATTRKIRPSDMLNSVRPIATQSQGEAGTDNTTSMSPLTTFQAIDAKLPNTAAGRAMLAAANPAAQRTLLGLGGAALLSVGTTAGTVAAGDDSRILGAAQKSANLSDLASASTSRTNLGLGNSATLNVGSSAGTVAAGDDIRFAGVAGIVDQATAEAGTNNTGIMSPLRTNQAVTVYGKTAQWQQGGTGAKQSTIDAELKAHAIRPDQFRLGSDTDDTASFLRARDESMSTGMPFHMRAGHYTVSDTIEFDLSSVTQFETSRYSITGDGVGITNINLTGNFDFLQVTGGTSAGVEHQSEISGFKIDGHGVGRGLVVSKGGHIRVEDVLGYRLDDAFYLVDCLSSNFVNISARWCFRGVHAVRSSFTHPNALAFFGCKLGNCHNWGMTIEGGAALTYIGGSIEGCGLNGTISDRGGVLLYQPGNEGGVACNISTYFEQNGPTADVYLIAGTKPVVCNVNGSLFNRVTNTEPNLAPHHVKVLQDPGMGEVKVNIGGAAFRSYDGYVPSAAKRVVNFVASGVYSLHGQNEAIYQNPVERPNYAGTEPVAVCRFNGTGATGAKAFTNANNVSAVTKIATGHYRVTLMQATGISSKSVQVTTNDFASTTQLVGEAVDSVDFYVVSAGALADASNVTVRVYDG